MHHLEPYDYIFWDWNGTLLDDLEMCRELINVSLTRRGLPAVDRQTYLEVFQFPVIKYYEALGFDFSRESYEEIGLEFVRAYSQRMFECPLQAGAREALVAAGGAGRRQCILSALNQAMLGKAISHFQLGGHFHDIRGLDDVYAHSKVGLGRELLRSIGADDPRAVMIGDTLHDYETATELGIDCILIANGHNARHRLESCGVPVFGSLPELLG